MAINFGNSEIDKIFFGSSQIDKVYKGSQLIYELSNPVATGNNLYGWGYNINYRLGLGHNTSPVTYAELITFPNNLSGEISDIFISTSVFAVINGNIYGWGDNLNRYLGSSLPDYVTTPTLIADGGNWKHVRSYELDKYAINQNGELYHWTDSYSSRTQFSTITNWDSLYGGYGVFFGVTTNGDVYAWGRNGTYHLLGTGSTSTSYVATSPILILTDSSGIKKISMTSLGVALITNDGKLYTWGSQYFYELGDNRAISVKIYTPAQRSTFSDWTDISLMDYRCYGLRNGQIYVWGQRVNEGSSNSSIPTLLSTIIPDVNNLNNNISNITAGGWVGSTINNRRAVLFAKRENSLITYGLYNSTNPLLGFYDYSIPDLEVVNSTLKFDKIYFYGSAAFATTITGNSEPEEPEEPEIPVIIDSYLVDKDNNTYYFDLSNTPITNFEGDTSKITVNGNQILKTYINEIHFGDSYANVTTIGDYFLGNCENLVTLDINKLTNITSIGNFFIYNCKSLAAIDLTVLSNVASVGDYFLGLCTSITSIDLSPLSNLTTIGDKFLSLCYSLLSIDFTPLSNVTTIGSYFLMNCEELTTVDLSSLTNLSSIGTHFLYYCSKLTTLIMGAITPPTLGISAFNRSTLLSSIIVPCGSVDSYKDEWYSSQKINLISDICDPEPTPQDGLFVLGRVDGFLIEGVNYTDELIHSDFFTENIDEITSEGSSYAVISNGKLYTWGSNSFGQLGQGNTISRVTPKQVGVDANWTKVSMGKSHTLAIKNGELYGWGDNYNKQITLTGNEYLYPIELTYNNDWVEVYAFENTSLAKRSNGLWYGWGNSENGEIGYPNDSSITQLPHSTILSGASKLTFGKQHGLVINNGSLYGFGNGANYVFGNGNTQQYSYPVKLNDLTWTDIACGYNFSFGISNGELYFWGDPSSSVSGYGATETVTSPQKVDNNLDWTNIYVTKGSNNVSTVIGIRNGDAYIWGTFYEYREDLSSWATIYISTPELLETNTNIINVVGGQTRMLILKQS